MTDEYIVIKALNELSLKSKFISYQEVENATGLSEELLDKVLCDLRDKGKLVNVQHLGGTIPMIFSLA